MNTYYEKSPVRVPVRLVDGQWEYFYGWPVPVREGVVADLIVERSSITDPEFLKATRRREEHKLLDEGATLLVVLAAKDGADISDEHQNLFVRIDSGSLSNEYFWTPRPAGTRFIGVQVGPPSAIFSRQRPGVGGGVWLQLEGVRPKGVVVSSVILPDLVSATPVDSLNHAFTKLSEVFEPWRKSHTGNIYTRVLYQEANGKWYPLQRLRSAAEATEEHALIKARGLEFMSKFSPEPSL